LSDQLSSVIYVSILYFTKDSVQAFVSTTWGWFWTFIWHHGAACDQIPSNC